MSDKTEVNTKVDIMGLIEIAVKNNNENIMSYLTQLRDDIKREQAKEAFYAALSALQSELPAIPHTKRVNNKDGSIRYTYAAYEDIVKVVFPLLKKYGLSVIFKTSFDDGDENGEKIVTVECYLTHTLGHHETTSFRAPVNVNSGRMLPIQEYGAALTYAKRYSLSLALGLATEEDTDAINTNEVSEVVVTENKITENQLRAIHNILNRRGYKEEDKVKVISKALGKEVKDIKDISRVDASKVIDAIQKEI